MIKIIAAVGKNLELGKKGDLIWQLPNDLKFFKEQTQDSVVVMGRNTFNSLPKKLPKRRHLVITDVDNFNKSIEDVDIFYNFAVLLSTVRKQAVNTDVFIIGGASVYRQFMFYADELILTEVDAEDKEADVYFPFFDKHEYDRQVIASNEDNGIKYTHVRYLRKK